MNWLNYFQQNRASRIEIPWQLGLNLEPHLRAPLIRSLQRFQVGESGEGHHLLASAEATGDDDYADAIRLFIKEEQDHANWLARSLERMGAPLLDGHWSDSVFVCLRRQMGLKLELLVLMVAEMIAKRYYRALRERTNDPLLRFVFSQILRDELGHVTFHCDTLNRVFAPMPPLARLAIHLTWKTFYRAVCLVVLVDHRSVLRACGVSSGTFWYDCGLIFDDAAARIFYPELDTEETIATPESLATA